MISTTPSSNFVATVTGKPAGLVGEVGVRVISLPDGAEVVDRFVYGVAEPTPGTYSATITAPAASGDYMVVWDSPGGVWIETLQVGVSGGTYVVAGMTPAIDDIAALLRARTDVMGTEVGQFTADTRPTAAQVEQLIDRATNDVASRVGTTIKPKLVAQAKHLSSLQTARLVELSYFPEQTAGDDTVYAQLTAMFNTGIMELINAARSPMTTTLA